MPHILHLNCSALAITSISVPPAIKLSWLMVKAIYGIAELCDCSGDIGSETILLRLNDLIGDRSGDPLKMTIKTFKSN